MPDFKHLIKFTTQPDGDIYFADIGDDAQPPPSGTSLQAYPTFDNFLVGTGMKKVTIDQILAPVPREDLPIYCVGLNYKSHAHEASLQIPRYPPLWTKPCTALSNPNTDITMNEFCAQSLPDYEGEVVFVTSRVLKNASVSEARDAILGYTVGNDLSCRLFQLPDRSGGQFFFAKAFDGFAPIGSTLASPEMFKGCSRRLVTKVNGQVVQDTTLDQDMIFDSAKILSHMSQGTTIPAFTIIMTGTPAGVGAFRKPKTFLNHGDVVEVGMEGLSTLTNKIVFEIGYVKNATLWLQRLAIWLFTMW